MFTPCRRHSPLRALQTNPRKAVVNAIRANVRGGGENGTALAGGFNSRDAVTGWAVHSS